MVDLMQCVSVPRREFLKDMPNTYLARLTNRQWRLVVSALSESGHEESEELARDLLKYVLPP
jgi:hypothetical protein